MCDNCRSHVKKYHLTSHDGSGYNGSSRSQYKECTCLKSEKLSSLAQQLHKKLSKTLETKSNFFQKCIDCGDVVD